MRALTQCVGCDGNVDTYRDWQDTYNTKPVALPNWGMTIESLWLSPEEAKAIDESKYINNSSIVTARYASRDAISGELRIRRRHGNRRMGCPPQVATPV